MFGASGFRALWRLHCESKAPMDMVVVEDEDDDVTLEHSGDASSAGGFSGFFLLGAQTGGGAKWELLVESNEKFWQESLSIAME